MKPTDPQQTAALALAAIELKICNALDEYNNAVFSGNDELSQMIHLSIQSLKRKRERLLLLK